MHTLEGFKLTGFITAGLNVVRMNFSHGSYEVGSKFPQICRSPQTDLTPL